MSKLIDLTNKVFGDLTVIKRGPNTSDNKAQWYCICSCGKEVLKTSKSLRQGSTHCGCKKKTTVKDLTGQRFGRLLVINREGSINNKATWNCLCDCGRYTIVRGSDLIANKIKSCGCLKTEMLSQDLTNMTFGKLTVLRQTDKRLNGSIVWECKCECGNLFFTSTNHLISGNTQSCGCLTSKGEQTIINFLQKNNINYAKQYMFSDLIGKKKHPLRFDFAIFSNFNNSLLGLIEFQGIQHYSNVFNLSDKDWEYSLQRDKMKKQYCEQNNIPLLEIKYDEKIEIKIKEWLKCLSNL